MSWAPQTGKVWVAADTIIQEVDLFRRDAKQTKNAVTGLTKPYISRVTNDDRVLYVDGVSGVSNVYWRNASTGETREFAKTKDDYFTRNITPVGIAVDPDGSACYIADASTGNVVKIPVGAGPGQQTIKDRWGGRSFSFPDPCGIDVNTSYDVIVATNNVVFGYPGWTWDLAGPNSATYHKYVGTGVHAIEIDRDCSTAQFFFYAYSHNLGFAEGFNLNPVVQGDDNSKRYHGAAIFAAPSGQIVLNPDGIFFAGHHYPQRVVINDSSNGSWPCPSANQVANRIIKLDISGWPGILLQLRVIDPPDLAPYAPDLGWSSPPLAVLPYEGNDNKGTTDYGLADKPDATTWATTIKLAPGSDYNLPVYLKVPERYSGDNFQVEVTKCDATGTVLPHRVTGLSAVYTSWKRVFVERDKMFKTGGLLYADFSPASCAPHCDQLTVYDWTNVAKNDTIVIFDEKTTAENGGEVRTINNITDLDGNACDRLRSIRCVVTLNAPLTKSYAASPNNGSTPLFPTFCDDNGNNCHSAGFGVLSNCDASPNQINADNSCFYDADMRGVELPYDDAYVEFIGLRAGMGAVPFLNSGTLGVYTYPRPAAFHKTWFQNMIPSGPYGAFPHNYFHLIGVGENQDDASGWSYADNPDSDISLVATGWIIANPQYGGLPQYARQATDHELGHQFHLNPCDPGGHDANYAWCGRAYPITCYSSPPGYERCVMYENKEDPDWWGLIEDDINRFCCINLFGPVAGTACGNASCSGDNGIRNDVDPE